MKVKIRDGMHTDQHCTKRWYKNGKLHREDGPAVIHRDGAKEWYWNDRRHRSDGPAVVGSDNCGTLYVYGRYCLTAEEWVTELLEGGWIEPSQAIFLKLKFA
jgi:hypothetical protein